MEKYFKAESLDKYSPTDFDKSELPIMPTPGLKCHVLIDGVINTLTPCSPPNNDELSIQFADWIVEQGWHKTAGKWHRYYRFYYECESTAKLFETFKKETAQ